MDVKLSLYFLLLCIVSAHAGLPDVKKAESTENRFAREHQLWLSRSLMFSKKGGDVAISGDRMPLEAHERKGFEASDGILSVGDVFIWPGCGFDRSQYTVHQIADDYVVIKYSQGRLPVDGYHDTGLLRIECNQKPASE